MMTRQRLGPGFSLLEMVGVMTALTLILLLLSTALTGALRSQQVAARVSQRLRAQAGVADQFRGDVARAASAPMSLGEMKADRACLILRLPDGKHILYRCRDGQLERSTNSGAEEQFRPIGLGDLNVAAEFGREADGTILSLRLIERARRGGEKQVVEVKAALGGDLR
jgi:type II secretory pathway pseudopilin PulG